MAALELKFLGDLAVVRAGERLALPPSKKTRALLAYLALNRRSFRREHLCDLLWEIPDDPRGSLRWSLSKLRRLVDDEAHQRIRADRASICFDPTGVVIDIAALKTVADGELDRASLEELESAATRYRGNALEGLELPNFQDFDAWRVAECEEVVRAQAKLLAALTARLEDAPARALPHARAWVSIAPYDERARASLIRLLVALGRNDQAQQQYQTGLRMLKEIGAISSGELLRALRSVRPTPVVEPEPAPQPCTPARVASRSVTSLVGRDAELNRVAAALLQTIEQRRGRLLLFTGEPGIGKSRLLEAAADMARQAGAQVLEACAYASESIRPFALWTDALRKLESAAARAIFSPGDQGNRERLFDALGQFIAGQIRAHCVALVFDDLQWGDESSAAALHYVVRTHREQPLFGVLAAREDELRDNTAMACALRELRQAGLLEVIDVEPLTEAAVRELIQSRLPQASTERLSKECGGNPLLALELARAEAAGDSGQSLNEVVQERLLRLDDDGGDILRWAAVLAPRIDARFLARVTELDWNQIGEVLETAARHSMLLPTERGFRFSHDLIARSIYAGLSPARRRTMHRRIAELLEQDVALDPERAADLAHHAAQSGDPALAARAMVSAGRLCLRFFANDEATTLANKGLQWTQQLPDAERVCLTLELREVMLSAAPLERWEEAAREYSALADQALDHGSLAHARRGYFMASYVHWQHGHWSGAREEIRQSERVARAGGDREHIIGMAEAARCLALLERDLPDADAMLMEAQALAARKQVRHHAIPAARGMLLFYQHKLDEATDLFKESRALARSAGDRLSEYQSIEYLAMIDIERARPQSAKLHCAALIELGDKLREGSERPFARALDALCHYALSDDDAPLDAALVELRFADAKHRLGYTLTRAALLDVERERPQKALTRAGEALRHAQTLDRPSEILLAQVALARACEAANDAAGYARHAAAVAGLMAAPVATWARDRATPLALRAQLQSGAAG